VFSDAILAANLAALERLQGERPFVTALTPGRARTSGDGAASPRLEVQVARGPWMVTDLPIGTPLPRQIVVLGPALGAVMDTVIRAGAATRIVALEPDPGLAALLLAQHDWSARIAAGRLCVLTGPDYRGAINCARLLDVTEPPMVLASPALGAYAPRELTMARSVVVKLVAEATANTNARKRFAGRYLLQTLGNLPVIRREGDAAALDGRFTGRPAVVVGAGPTLDENLPVLAARQDRVVIISVDTALRPLLAGGVRPHLVVAVDPAELNAQHLAGLSGLDDIWLAAEGSLHPSAFEAFAGRTFVFKVSDHEPWPWLKTMGLDRGGLRAWGSVVTSAFDLALRMGCDPIVFVGLDLSYPVRRPYCANTIYDQKWRDAMVEYGCTWEQLVDEYFGRVGGLSEPDVHGAPVVTSAPLVSFRDWLRQQIAAGTGRRVVNATGAGILHGPRLEQTSLSDALAGASPLGTSVCDALRGAHASSLTRHDRVAAAATDLLRRPGAPHHAELLQGWSDFSAGSLSPLQICERLSRAIEQPG